jgi:tRNA1Val (adenine37-N6)-methyltransferase
MKVSTDGVLLGAWANPLDVANILDIGTGTGLIAIMLAQKSQAKIDAVEIELHAYLQASENVSNCPWKQRIRVFQSSFQDFSKQSDETYEYIVSNPPFFSHSLKTPSENRNLARHNDTLPPEELLSGIDRILSPEGRFCIILPSIGSSHFITEAALHNLYCCRKTNVKPTPKKKISRALMEFSRIRCKILETELTLRTDDQNYTEDYKLLTKDFYLFL